MIVNLSIPREDLVPVAQALRSAASKQVTEIGKPPYGGKRLREWTDKINEAQVRAQSLVSVAEQIEDIANG